MQFCRFPLLACFYSPAFPALSLSLARCPQELVYKQGQAGVTRASVTICFNNKDKKGSPVGYESYDEISVWYALT